MGRSSQNKEKRRRWLIAEVLSGLLLVLLLLLIARQVFQRAQISAEERSAAGLVQTSTAAPSPRPEEGGLETAHPTAEPPSRQDLIQTLRQQNQNTVGILEFDADRVMYVCQGEDNRYYMTHTFDHSENPAGMIYMDYRNSLEPRSDNLILYGHNMNDGSRFGTLKRFTLSEYLLANPVFRFSDPYETVEYLPFAIFYTTVLTDDPAYFKFDRTDFVDDVDFNAYVKEVRARSVLNLPVEVTSGDRLLTLATCSNAHDRGRLVIVCREKHDKDPAG